MADRYLECKECGLPVRESELHNHVQNVHKMGMDQYDTKHPEPEEYFVKTIDIQKEVDKQNVKDTPVGKQPIKVDLLSIKGVKFQEEILKQYFPDKYKYFMDKKREYIDSGFPESAMLNDLCFWHLVSRDKQLKIMSTATTADNLFDPMNPEIKAFSDITESMTVLLKQINEIYERTRKERQMKDEVDDLLKKAEQYVRQNVGEFDFKCQHCGRLIDNSGCPHWAFEIKQDENGKNLYLLWCGRLWELVLGIDIRDDFGNINRYQIEPYIMCMALETNIEGLGYTAKQRGMDVKRDVIKEQVDNETVEKIYIWIDGFKIDVLDQENKFRKCYDYFMSKYHEKCVKDL